MYLKHKEPWPIWLMSWLSSRALKGCPFDPQSRCVREATD